MMPPVPPSTPAPARVLHALNLDTVGGVEQLFFHLITGCDANAQQEDHCLVTGGRVHEYFSGMESRLGSLHYTKFWRAVKIPRRPRVLRDWHRRNLIRRIRPELAVMWNRFGDGASLADLRATGCPVLHYEHGAGWLAPDSQGNREFLRGVAGAICISRAAQRVLQLRWDYRGPTHVVPNALRPDLAPVDVRPKALPTDRPLRLGVAARLIPLKGVGVALHTLRELHRRGCPAELHIAGTGPLQPFLMEQTRRLGLGTAVRFLGVVRDMAQFYEHVDLLLAPALREPFGLVVIEAAAHGCPAVCSRVDGLPEAVVAGRTGICLDPSLDLSHATDFGGTPGDFPPLVYEPSGDRLVAPRFLAPDALASAVGDLLASPEQFAAMSAAAIRHARDNFAWPDYARRLREVFARILNGR